MALPVRPVVALLINTLVFGICWWPLRKLDDTGLHALWATAITYLALSLVVLVARPGALREFLTSPAIWMIAIASGLTNAGFNWGVVIGDVIRVVLLFYLMPVWAALAGRWLLSEPITGGAILRISVAVLGAALILYEPDIGLPVPSTFADWLGLAGGFWFAINNVLLRRHAAHSAGALVLAMMVGGFLIPGAIAIGLFATGHIPIAAPTGNWLPWLALLAVLILVANTCLLYGAARLPANVVATIMVAEVFFAALSAVIIAGESVDTLTLVGGALIIGSSIAAAHAASDPKQSKH